MTTGKAMDAPNVSGPLAGLRVVDFTRVLAGPYGTQMLGDMGADVIKIENPVGGDDTRLSRASPDLGGESPMFLALNRSKRSVAIDLNAPDGRQVALDLIATADVLVENFTTKVMRRLMLDHESLRARFPRLIYCSISGYGRTGSNADAGGYDAPVAAEAGLIASNGYAGVAPVLGAIPYTDLTTSMNATIAILAALRARDRTGTGQHIDVAMFDSAVANLTFHGYDYLVTGREPRQPQPQIAGPRGIFATSDGHIVITCGNDKMFRALCAKVLDKPEWLEDPRFAKLSDRLRNSEAFLAEIGAVFSSRSRAEWSALCKQASIPCGPVRTPGEALTSDEAQERGITLRLNHQTAGTVPGIAQPFRFSDTPCSYGAPPALGQHSREVLAQLAGYDRSRIAALEEAGVIRAHTGRSE